MDQWININEGRYLASQVLLVAVNGYAVEMVETVINIYNDHQGTRRLQGQGFINSLAVIELLEESDDLDILLDLGDGFKFRLNAPTLSGGKIFVPAVKSAMAFIPTQPWTPLSEKDFSTTVESLTLIGRSQRA